jgi:hypothetical protein
MSCAACGSENLPSARFCAACGKQLGGGGVALAPRPPASPLHARIPAPRMTTGQPLLVCSRCGRPMSPAAYFSRGANVAKAMLLFIPLSFFGPLLFFLLRKDRLICSICKGMLSGEASVPLLQAFSTSVATTAAAHGLSVYDPEEDLAVLEHQSRRHRARAWTWGAASAGMAGLGMMMTVDGSLHSTVGALLLAAPAGLGAVAFALRSRAFGKRAVLKRGRQQRAHVLELARAHGGRLTVSLVAAELRIELADAERLLTDMVDGHRVEMDVDDSGRITYVFTELAG